MLQDKFRVENGDRLLELLEGTYSRKMNSPQGLWLISLSKPTKQEHQLLMTLANDQGNTHMPTFYTFNWINTDAKES